MRGIASAHTARDYEEFKPEGGSNYIFIVDMGGLRIAHFGDIGQEYLTEEQLAALGERGYSQAYCAPLGISGRSLHRLAK